MNGVLSAKGQNGQADNAGGGSGGSIVIKSTNITGHGEINVRGGNGGIGEGGAGAGGRIAVLCTWRYQYGGEYVDNGGLGVRTDGTDNLLFGAAAGIVLNSILYKYWTIK